jgi:hypothetical protein
MGWKIRKKKEKNATVELGFGVQTALKLRTSQYACCLITVARAQFRFDLRALLEGGSEAHSDRFAVRQIDRRIDCRWVFAFTGDAAFGVVSFDS